VQVAREIEDPFWNDPNSLPLANTQHMVNELLLALAGSTRPVSNMDARPLAYEGLAPATGLGGSGSNTPFNSFPFAAPSSPSAAAAATRRKEPSLLVVTVAAAHSAGAAGASRGPVSPAASPRWGAAPGRPQLPGLSALQVTVPAASSPAGASKGGSPFNRS
jgi:hypothetical protein